MSKTKYYYDSNTLSYKKIRKSKKEKTMKAVYFTLFILINFLTGFVILSQFIKSPKQREQARELENMELNFKLLNKKIRETSEILKDLQERDNNVYRTYFEVAPISEAQRQAGFGGVHKYKHLDGFDSSEIIKKSTKDIDILSKQIVMQSQSLDEIVKLAKKKEEMLSCIPAIQPVKKEETRLASGYGMRMHPILKRKRMHKGMDFASPIGTPIYATGDGKVTRANRSDSYGNVVYINHGYGYETRYAHMSKIATKKGAKVKRGQIIGYVGNTGRSSGAHLHYEVHKNGKTVNPIYFYYKNISPKEYKEMQKEAQRGAQSFD